MYSHCLFCNQDLGRNEALGAFPVGRRLAYDAVKGRLWVVCPACARWNLTPLEERWEAIEQAERLFRAARLRVSTDNVGLARVVGAADLVRIGRPTRPEFASWRYADVFARRRRRAIALQAAVLTAGTAIAGGIVWGAVASGVSVLTLAWWAKGLLEPRYDPDREAAVERAADDALATHIVITRKPVRITRGAVRRATLRDDGEGFRLTFPFGRESRTMVGEPAKRATAAMLTYLNAAGAPAASVNKALDALVAAGSAEAFITQLGRRARWRPGQQRNTSGGFAFGVASPQTRLALEMALNDEQERRAMDGDLAELERAWRDAEEIAAIADELLLPERVQRAFGRLRGREGAA